MATKTKTKKNSTKQKNKKTSVKIDKKKTAKVNEKTEKKPAKVKIKKNNKASKKVNEKPQKTKIEATEKPKLEKKTKPTQKKSPKKQEVQPINKSSDKKNKTESKKIKNTEDKKNDEAKSETASLKKISQETTETKKETNKKVDKQEKPVVSKPKKHYPDDYNFLVKYDTSFLDGIVQVKKGTNINRLRALWFNLTGVNENNMPFSTPFQLLSEEEDKRFFNELIDHEESGQNNNEKLSKKAFEGKPLDSFDIEKFAAMLPPIPVDQIADIQKTASGQTPQIMGGEEIKIDADEIMESYGETIYHNVSNTIQARLQGGLPISEMNNVLQNCSKDYTYQMKQKDGKWYLELTRGTVTVRVPKNENEFMPVL